MKVLFLPFLPLTSSLAAETLLTFDFFGNGLKEQAATQLDAMVLDQAMEKPLPPEFTICCSIFMRSLIMEQSLLQVLTKDDIPWFSLYFLHLNETLLTFPLSLGVDGVYTHLASLPANPLQWNHVCIGLNTLTGLVRVAANGRIVQDGVMDLFIASQDKVPQNLTSRLVLGRWFFQDKWLQSLSTNNNINIFGRLLTRCGQPGLLLSPRNEVKESTEGQGCSKPGDFLAWDQMVWRKEGQRVKQFRLSSLCHLF